MAETLSNIEDLLRWLRGNGFEIACDRTFEAFGNRTIVLSNGSIAVRAMKDRGIWMIDVAASLNEVPSESSSIWFEPKIWLSYLEETIPFVGPSQLEDQVEFVKTRLPDVEAALLEDAEAAASLFALRKTEAHTRFSSARQLPPP